MEGNRVERTKCTDKLLSLADRVMKKMQAEETSTEAGYIGPSLLFAMSNICERLYPKAVYALSDRREGTAPIELRAPDFLAC